MNACNQTPPSDSQGCSEQRVTGIRWSGKKEGTKKENTYGTAFRTLIKVVLQTDFTKPLIEGDRVIALCVTPTVWIISLVNPVFKGDSLEHLDILYSGAITYSYTLALASVALEKETTVH